MSGEIEEMLHRYAQHQDRQAPPVTATEARDRAEPLVDPDDAFRVATGRNGSHRERSYLVEQEAHRTTAFAGSRSRRRLAIVAVLAAAVIVVTVAVVVTRPGTHRQPKPATTVHVPAGQLQLYWSDPAGINRANVDGTDMAPNLIPSNDFATGSLCGLAVDRNYIYWGTQGRVARVKRDGTGLDPSFIALPGAGACDVAVDGAHIYWAGPHEIGRANLDGTHVQQAFIRGPGVSPFMSPCGVAVDGAHIYWTDPTNGTIGRANLDGTGVNPDLIVITGLDEGPGRPAFCNPVVDGAHIYWGTSMDTIGRANLDGTGVNLRVISGLGVSGGYPPIVCALDTTHLYWVDVVPPQESVVSWIGRAGLDGTDVQDHLITVLNGSSGCGIGP